MARIRSIKPDFFFDEDIAELKFVERLAFIGLWVIADKEGRLEYIPKRVKALTFPYDNIEIETIIKALEVKPFIRRYEINGKIYIQILNWHKHQRPHHTEKESEIPPLTVKPPLNNGENQEEKGKVVGEGKGRVVGEDSPEPQTPAASAPDPVLLSFPVVGRDRKEWELKESKAKEYQQSFPGVNILSQCKIARQWCIDNPPKRKTYRGMPAFLSRWFAREQNRGGNKFGKNSSNDEKYKGIDDGSKPAGV